MDDDRRVAAPVNLEGYPDYPPDVPDREGELLPTARPGADRPLLMFGTDGFRAPGFARSRAAVPARSSGRAVRRQLDDAGHGVFTDDAGHGVFTDCAAMAPQLQAAGLMTAAARTATVGAIDPARSVPAVRDRARSFFGRRLPSD
ncbi:hypothetical protein [Streptomyces sp. NPDC020141]|uniref:hypothetical protein n=1 Tax=Streptomyces sp. NPDC020141 TaxID=3365065 RepID=UPI0037B3F11D